MLAFELESGLKCTQQVVKLSSRDHNKTNPKPESHIPTNAFLYTIILV